MGDSHQMIVHYVCKIIGRIAVRLDQDQIFHFLIIYCDISVNHIMEGSGSLCGHIKPDHMRLSCCKTSFHFFLWKLQAALVINGNFFSCHHALHGFQFFLSAEAVVSVALIHKLSGIFQIKTGCLTLTLHIRSYAAVFVRTLIMKQSCLFHGAVNNINRPFHITLLICILNAENKITALMFGDQICV